MSKQEDEDLKLGRVAGRAWAESGRSIAAVEAVARSNRRFCWEDEDEEREGSFAVMAEAVGDDEEFEALNQRSNAYQWAWHGAVQDVFEEWNE
jgi:hypothetical protein